MSIPPVRTPLEIGSHSVTITTTGTVISTNHPGTYALSLTADLAGLQTHAAEILAEHLDRSDPRGERISVTSATLVASQPLAILTAGIPL